MCFYWYCMGSTKYGATAARRASDVLTQDNKQLRGVKIADCRFGVCNYRVDFEEISHGFMVNLEI